MLLSQFSKQVKWVLQPVLSNKGSFNCFNINPNYRLSWNYSRIFAKQSPVLEILSIYLRLSNQLSHWRWRPRRRKPKGKSSNRRIWRRKPTNRLRRKTSSFAKKVQCRECPSYHWNTVKTCEFQLSSFKILLHCG